jgi:hypothetical protein
MILVAGKLYRLYRFHINKELEKNGYETIILENLANGHKELVNVLSISSVRDAQSAAAWHSPSRIDRRLRSLNAGPENDRGRLSRPKTT